jgi:hypothetical protein
MRFIAAWALIGKLQITDDDTGEPKSTVETYFFKSALEGKAVELLDSESRLVCKKLRA